MVLCNKPTDDQWKQLYYIYKITNNTETKLFIKWLHNAQIDTHSLCNQSLRRHRKELTSYERVEWAINEKIPELWKNEPKWYQVRFNFKLEVTFN